MSFIGIEGSFLSPVLEERVGKEQGPGVDLDPFGQHSIRRPVGSIEPYRLHAHLRRMGSESSKFFCDVFCVDTEIDRLVFFCLQVISSELIRNLGLTMAAVVVVTLILISDLVTVFWVFTCIAFTLIDLLGLMYFWGLTVEISSSIIVILAAGLAIDYSAHIGHTLTTIRGSKSSTPSNCFP